jgi:hypothetical protein
MDDVRNPEVDANLALVKMQENEVLFTNHGNQTIVV